MKRFARILCAVLLLLCLTGRASAENSATKVDLYCTVNPDGGCLVSMTVNLHLDGADANLRFPLPYAASNITMNGNSVFSTRVGNATMVSLGKAAEGLVGDFPIRFDFTIPKAVQAITLNPNTVKAVRRLQLEIPMVNGFEYPIEELSFIVTLPGNVDEKPSFYSIYQQAGFESNLDVLVNGNMITGASRNVLNDHEAVTMTLLVPTDMFPTVSTYERTGNPELVPMGIFAGLALLYWLLFLRTLPPARQRATLPPEGISAGELNCRITMRGGDLTMMVLSWAQMGYLLIHMDSRGRVILHKRMDMGNERSLFEVRIFQSLFRDGRQNVNCSSRGYAALMAKTAAMVPGEKTMCKGRSGSRRIFRSLLCIGQIFCGVCVTMNLTSIPLLQFLFSCIFGLLSALSAWFLQEFAFHIRDRHKFKVWLALGLCVFWILLGAIGGQPWIPMGAVVFQLLCGYLAAYGGMRTELNRSQAGEILGLRRYLRSIPREEAGRLLSIEPGYFYRLAPYAIALGVGKQYAACFSRRKMEPCPYFVNNRQKNNTSEEWMALMMKAVMTMDDRYYRTKTEKWTAIRFR